MLASADDDGSVHVWDLQRLRLVHVLKVHPPRVHANDVGAIVGMQLKEETGELAVATPHQLQLWSINAALLAVRAEEPPSQPLPPRSQRPSLTVSCR